MSSADIATGLVFAIAFLSLWAAIFATRADRASRRAVKLANSRWEATTRPVPHLTFTGQPGPGQSIEMEVENLGGTVTAGGIIVQSGDDLYAAELTLPEKAAPRRILLPPVMKAWQRASQPTFLLLIARDISGRSFDCLHDSAPIKDPRKWLAGQLRELRLQGVVEFPGLAGPAK